MIKFSSSKTKTLFETEWLSLKENPDGFIFVHTERGDGHSVAVLGWREDYNGLKILGRFEPSSAHGDKENKLVSLTGCMEERFGTIEETALKYAVQELEEEAGIKVGKKRFVSLGTIRPSKSSDTTMHLFSVELPVEEPLDNPKGDGTKNEKGTYCKWVSLDEIIASKDPVLHCLVLKSGII